MPETSTPFSTPESYSAYEKGSDHDGKSYTTGLRGTKRTLDDGTIIIEATEDLKAERADGLKGELKASWKSVQRGDVISVEQPNYSYKAQAANPDANRVLPPATLFVNVGKFPDDVPVLSGFKATPAHQAKATRFGKFDEDDEGTGAPEMGLIQTNSEVVGASVRISIMEKLFGPDWRHNEKRLGALAEVFFKDSDDVGRLVRAPLVDVGPGAAGVEVDLTWASDQFLKTDGGASILYRILIPI